MKEKTLFNFKSTKSTQSFFHSGFIQLLSLHQKPSQIFELSLVIIEYVQLLCQIILTTTKAPSTSSITDSLINYILKMADFINLGYSIGLLRNSVSNVTLILMCCYILAVYSGIIYTLITSLKGKRQINAVIWFTVQAIKLHGRVVFYFILMCAVGCLKANFDNLEGIDETYVLVFSIISISLMLLSYILPLATWGFCSYLLPSKSTLSAMTYKTELITLTQKLIQGILFVTLMNDSLMSAWIICIVHLVIGILRAREFFGHLPNYNLRILYWKGALITATFFLNLCFLAFNIQANVYNEEFNIASLIITWLILVVFTQMMYRSFYRQQIVSILLCHFKHIPPKKLMLKFHYLKQIRFNVVEKKEKFWKFTLLSMDKRLAEIFKIPEGCESEIPTAFQDSLSLRYLFFKTLQDAQLKYPKDDNLKLYCAYYFGKKMALYSASIKLLETLDNTSFHFSMNLNTTMLKSELQASIKSKQAKNADSLNIVEFININRKLREIKQSMTQQADLQLAIYKEWSDQTFDTGKIYRSSMDIEAIKKVIEKQTKRIQQERPDHFIEPLVLFAYYAVQLNLYPSEHANYMEMYKQRWHRYRSKLNENDLTQKSLYSPRNVELVLSTKLENCGVVVSCSSNIHKYLGWNPNFMIGKTFSSLAPPSLNRYYQQLIVKTLKSSNDSLSSQDSSCLFITHSEGYIVPMNCHMSLYPFLEEGVLLHVVLRPIISPKDYIIVTRDGYIESYTAAISKRLNLGMTKHTKVQIAKLNRQLGNINMVMEAILLDYENERDEDYSMGLETVDFNVPVRQEKQKTDEQNLIPLPLAKTENASNRDHKPTEAGKDTNREGRGNGGGKTPRMMRGLTKINFGGSQDAINSEFGEEVNDTPRSRKSVYGYNRFTNFSQFRLRSEKSIAIDNAQQVYDKLKNQGKTLKLIPLAGQVHAKQVSAQKNNLTMTEEEYNCNIENRSYGNNILKLFILEQIRNRSQDFDNENDSQNPSMTELEASKTLKTVPLEPEPNEDVGTPKSPVWPNASKEKEEENEGSGHFDTDEERTENERAIKIKNNETVEEKETIFDTLNSPTAPFIPLGDLKASRFGNETSPKSILKTDQSATKLPFVNTLKEKKKGFSAYKNRIKAFTTMKGATTAKTKKMDIGHTQSVGSVSSRVENVRMYKLLKAALDMKYHSRWTSIFIGICYVFIATFFATQVWTSIDSRSQFSTLDWNKEVLINAIMRADLVVRITRRLRCLALIPEGQLTQVQLDALIANSITTFTNLAISENGQLITANKDLLIDSSFLGAHERSVLFLNNVKVYNAINQTDGDDDAYDMLTTFQAVDRLIDLNIKALTLSKVSLAAALPTYYLIFKNSLNEMIITSRENVDTMSTLLETLHNSLLDQTKAILAVITTLFGLLMIGFFIMLFRQYSKEILILTSLSIIDKTKMQDLAKKVINFKININEDHYYEESNIEFMEGYGKELLALGMSAPDQVKQRQILKNNNIISRYFKKLLKILVFFICFAAFIIIDRVLLLETANNLYTQVEKIHFMKQLQEEITLGSGSYVEVMFANGTTTIMNEPSEEFYAAQMTKLTNLKAQVPTILQNNDHSMDPYIEQALSGFGCPLLTGTLVATCIKNAAGAQEAGLLYFFTKLEYIITGHVGNFLLMNRTQANISLALYNVIGLTMPVNNIVTGLIEAITAYINTQFDAKVTSYANTNIIINAVGIGILLMLSGLLWRFVLKRMRDCDNNLKKILKNIPLNLVMKNYRLRAFILNTSGGSLNSIKNKW